MYNRALSAAEVLALYQEYDSKIAISTLQSGLVGRWIGSPADSTSITRDQTPQGNNGTDRKSTRLNSSHSQITHAVFFFKKTAKTASSIVTFFNILFSGFKVVSHNCSGFNSPSPLNLWTSISSSPILFNSSLSSLSFNT